MMIFSGQSKVATDPRRSKGTDGGDNDAITKYNKEQEPAIDMFQKQEMKKQKKKNNRQNYVDNNYGTLTQINQPPSWLESAQFWAIGITTMIAGYLMYFLWIDYFSPIRNFLLYVLKPGSASDLTAVNGNSLYFGAPLLFWMGVDIISVKGILRVWPYSTWVFLAVFFVVLLPMFLLWFIWPFSFLAKIAWTVCYLSNVWLFFMYEL